MAGSERDTKTGAKKKAKAKAKDAVYTSGREAAAAGQPFDRRNRPNLRHLRADAKRAAEGA